MKRFDTVLDGKYDFEIYLSNQSNSTTVSIPVRLCHEHVMELGEYFENEDPVDMVEYGDYGFKDDIEEQLLKTNEKLQEKSIIKWNQQLKNDCLNYYKSNRNKSFKFEDWNDFVYCFDEDNVMSFEDFWKENFAGETVNNTVLCYDYFFKCSVVRKYLNTKNISRENFLAIYDEKLCEEDLPEGCEATTEEIFAVLATEDDECCSDLITILEELGYGFEVYGYENYGVYYIP